MKAIFVALIALCATSSLLAETSLLRNGDFETGSNSWDGDRRVDYETDARKNKTCRMRVRDDDQTFHQEIKVRKMKDVSLRYRVRCSRDYEGRGYSVRFVREDGSYSYFDVRDLESEWTDKTFTFSDLQDSERIELMFIVRSGERGYLEFDDIEAIGSP